MKNILISTVLLLAPVLSARAALSSKVCTVFHDDKATGCVSAEKKDYPTSILYGVSRVTDAASLSVVHRWNGQDTVPMASLAQNKIIVSSFAVPVDFNGEVIFSVHDSSGQQLSQNTFLVARGSLALSAQLKPEAPKATPPVQKIEIAEMFIPTPHAEKPANVSAQKALNAKLVTETQPKPKAAPAKRTPPRPITEIKPPEESRSSSASSGLALLKFEIHGVYVKQKDLGETGTPILYWAPDWYSANGLGLGVRAGVAQWKVKAGERFTAFEGDAHLNLKMTSSRGHLILQPLVGYHSWKDFGQQVSYGGNLVMQKARSPFSFLIGGQVWKHEEISYLWINAGLGVEF